MKNHIYRMFTLAAFLLFVFTGSICAQSMRSLRATVSFSFVINHRSLPAGEYRIEEIQIAGSPFLKLQSADGHRTAILPAKMMQIETQADSYRLVFTHIAEQYVLSEVCGLDEKAIYRLYPSRHEAVVAKQADETGKDTISITARHR